MEIGESERASPPPNTGIFLRRQALGRRTGTSQGFQRTRTPVDGLWVSCEFACWVSATLTGMGLLGACWSRWGYGRGVRGDSVASPAQNPPRKARGLDGWIVFNQPSYRIASRRTSPTCLAVMDNYLRK